MWGARRFYLGWGLLVLLLLPAASDFVQWSYRRQQIQIVSEWTAAGAVQAIMRGEPVEAAVRRRIPRWLALTAPPAIEHPPRSGFFTTHPLAVRVHLSSVYAPFFCSLFLDPFPMSAQSTAAAIPTHRPGEMRITRVE